jgi:prepilin-type N-terminal cleavage/methylation domain-containing protein
MNTLKWLLTNQLKRSQPHKENGGYTLIELLVAMIMAALVITPLLGVMINILDTDRKEQAKTNSEQEVQAAIDYISAICNKPCTFTMPQELMQSKINCLQIQINPVLVFWKRELSKMRQLQKPKDKEKKDVTFTDDSFVYSLVAYYLIKDNKDPWSKAARIARFQIRDGVPNKNGNICSTAYDTSGKYTECPDDGFQQVNLVQKGKL